MTAPTRSSHLTSGSQIGKYVLIEELGRGGMGVVFLAEDRSLGRRVALKVLTPALAHEPSFQERFRSEASLVSKLNHPHIVRIHALDQTDAGFLIDMEYLEGGSLADLLVSHGVTLHASLRIVEQSLDALRVCHEAGVIHRDVKPSNILFDANGILRLTDFGLAKAADTALFRDVDVTRSSTLFLGTPRYAPPEAWEGESPTPQWDLYSLGAVMFECIAGRPMYLPNQPLTLLRELATGEPPNLAAFAPDLSPDLLSFGERLYARDPSARFPSAAEALAELRSVPEYVQPDADDSAQTRTLPMPKRRKSPWKSVRKPRWPIPVAAGLLVVLALSMAGFFMFQDSTGTEAENAVPLVSEPEAATLLQEQATFEDTLSLDSLARFSKAPTATYQTYEVFDLDTGARLTNDAIVYEKQNGVFAVLVTEAGLKSFNWRSGESRIAGGNWAEYHGTHATLLRTGAIAGSVQATSGGDLLCSLALSDDQSSGIQHARFRLSPADGTDTRMLLDIEQHSRILPLLYNELLPRQLAWAQAVEAELPALINGRCRAQAIAEGAIVLDGRLDEPTWTPVPLRVDTEAGNRHGRGPQGPSTLYVRESPEALYLGLRVASMPEGEPAIRVGLMGPLKVPLEETWRWFSHALLAADGTTHSILHEEQRSGTVPWQVQIHRDNSTLEAEIRFDYKSLGDSALPASWPVWRCNVQVLSVSKDGASRPVAVWGAPSATALEHGMIIRR